MERQQVDKQNASVERIARILNHLEYSSSKSTLAFSAQFCAAATPVYDVVVIGGGVNGASTAWATAKKGRSVALLEQFSAAHSRASSHGDGRIIRYAYGETVYIKMAIEAYKLWEELSRAHAAASKCSVPTLYHVTGGYDIYPDVTHPAMKELLDAYHTNKVPYQEYRTSDLPHKKQFTFEKEGKAIWQDKYGVVFAGRAVAALWAQAEKHGAKCFTNTAVKTINPINKDLVEVITTKGEKFVGKSVVVAAGSWTPSLIRDLDPSLDLGVTITSETLAYFPAKQGASPHTYENFPVVVYYGTDRKTLFYCLPQIDVPGVKIGMHYGGQPITDPNSRVPFNPKVVEKISEFVAGHWPQLEPRPIDVGTCLYTTTRDHHFTIDRHPKYKNIIIGSACSGHGFKFGPFTGTILSCLALNEESPLDIREFAIGRKEVLRLTA